MYCDSAILVKLLTPEPDSDVFANGLRSNSISVSELAWGEVSSALLSKERKGLVSPEERQGAWEQFEAWIDGDIIRMELLDSRLLRHLPVVLARCPASVPLRTLDAIHVATCDRCGDFPLAATDRRLRAAAHHLQIPLFPARLPTDLF